MLTTAYLANTLKYWQCPPLLIRTKTGTDNTKVSVENMDIISSMYLA
jgi:hypothetical protein